MTIDGAGNLYGTTAGGGGWNDGIVFKMAHKDTGWIYTPLYVFKASGDGAYPYARLTFGQDGALYGTTMYGGNRYGTVYRVQPPRSCRSGTCPWIETVLYSFQGNGDGWGPGDLAFDQQGNIYGTTAQGGDGCNGYCGVVFKLIRSGGSWTYSLIYSFQGGSDGANPIAGVVLDAAGNLYGTALNESGGGVVYQLTTSGSRRTDNVLYEFHKLTDANSPQGGLIFDRAGNLYGTNRYGGDYGTGTVYELSPAYGGWNYTVLASLPGVPGEGPVAALTMDDNGALYGTTLNGSVFRLTPSGNNWTLTQLGSGGGEMLGSVAVDRNGTIYGTDAYAGNHDDGIVFEITQ